MVDGELLLERKRVPCAIWETWVFRETSQSVSSSKSMADESRSSTTLRRKFVWARQLPMLRSLASPILLASKVRALSGTVDPITPSMMST